MNYPKAEKKRQTGLAFFGSNVSGVQCSDAMSKDVSQIIRLLAFFKTDGDTPLSLCTPTFVSFDLIKKRLQVRTNVNAHDELLKIHLGAVFRLSESFLKPVYFLLKFSSAWHEASPFSTEPSGQQHQPEP